MATGYTAKLMESGETFQEFAMGCARAFGALIEMRDDPVDAPIREFKPSPYYEESLTKHRSELARLELMTPDERTAFGEARKSEELASKEEWLAKDTAQNERLDAMRKEVLAWTPPSPDHEEMKKFMLQQISISVNGLSYIHESIAQIKAKTPIQLWSEAVESEHRGIAYSEENLAKEIDRVRGRNLWVKQLRESLSDLERATEEGVHH